VLVFVQVTQTDADL